MGFSLIGWGAFSLVFLIILGYISNQNPTALSNIQQQFNRMTCPMPAPSGLWNNTGTLMYQNGTYNIQDKSHTALTLTCTKVHTQYGGIDYFYGQGAGVPFAGVPFFFGDYIGEAVDKAGAFLTLIGIYLLPINFSILGFHLTDMSLNAQMAVIGIYAFCYIGIAVMVYKVVSPFAGSG